MKNRTLTEAEALRGKIIGWRRAFHQIPELQGETVMTEALISETLHSIFCFGEWQYACLRT